MVRSRQTTSPNVAVLADRSALAVRAADLIMDRLRAKPDLLLCAATGGTPTDTYAVLAQRRREDPLRFDRMRVVKLDEWLGMALNDDRSCESYLRIHVLEPLAVSPDRYVGFRGDASDPEAECERVRAWLRANGPVDLCLLGLGLNGHVGLNEPAAQPTPRAHVATLHSQTQRHPMLGTSRQPPTRGMTLGMQDLLDARQVLLLVSGAHKRGILDRLLAAAPGPGLPASLLKEHPGLTILCDRAAAAD